MTVVFICGSHPRHAAIARAIAETDLLDALIIEQREEHIPSPPQGLDAQTTSLFNKHFALRAKVEARFFGPAVFPKVATLFTTPEDLNTPQVEQYIAARKPALLLSYGCHKLSNQTLSFAQHEKWNIHGGLSPWYRGAVTHFWPSYMLEPQMTGMTIHKLTEKLDAGDVVHQCCADLVRGDSLHELAARAVSKLATEIPILLRLLASGKQITKHAHKTSGKLWLGRDWRPEHLKLIYELYEDRIVDHYLDNTFLHNAPNLIRQF